MAEKTYTTYAGKM